MSEKKKVNPEELSKAFLKETAKFTKEGMDKEKEAVLCFYKGADHMETITAGSLENFEELFGNLFQKEPQLMSVALHAASRSIQHKHMPTPSEIAEQLQEKLKSMFGKGDAPKVEVIDGTQMVKDIIEEKEGKAPVVTGEPGQA